MRKSSASTTAGDGDDVIAIARELVEQFSLKNVSHIDVETVLEKDGDIYYEGDATVSKGVRIAWSEHMNQSTGEVAS